MIKKEHLELFLPKETSRIVCEFIFEYRKNMPYHDCRITLNRNGPIQVQKGGGLEPTWGEPCAISLNEARNILVQNKFRENLLWTLGSTSNLWLEAQTWAEKKLKRVGY